MAGLATTQFFCGCSITYTMGEHKLWGISNCLKHKHLFDPGKTIEQWEKDTIKEASEESEKISGEWQEN